MTKQLQNLTLSLIQAYRFDKDFVSMERDYDFVLRVYHTLLPRDVEAMGGPKIGELVWALSDEDLLVQNTEAADLLTEFMNSRFHNFVFGLDSGKQIMRGYVAMGLAILILKALPLPR